MYPPYECAREYSYPSINVPPGTLNLRGMSPPPRRYSYSGIHLNGDTGPTFRTKPYTSGQGLGIHFCLTFLFLSFIVNVFFFWAGVDSFGWNESSGTLKLVSLTPHAVFVDHVVPITNRKLKTDFLPLLSPLMQIISCVLDFLRAFSRCTFWIQLWGLFARHQLESKISSLFLHP